MATQEYIIVRLRKHFFLFKFWVEYWDWEQGPFQSVLDLMFLRPSMCKTAITRFNVANFYHNDMESKSLSNEYDLTNVSRETWNVVIIL